jgi:glycosyltransferase involved in cell wall biosynthesis
MSFYFSSGNACARDKRHKEAINLYTQAIKYSPDFAQLYLNLANSLRSMGDYIGARAAYIQGKILENTADAGFSLPYWWSNRTKKITSDTVVVLVPVYNAEDTIKECLESVFSQNYKDLIVIAIDDASNDRSAEILDKLKLGYENLYVIKSKRNSGPFVSVNIGLFVAADEEFGFFIKHDSDDLMLPQKIELQVAEFKKGKNKKLCTAGYTRFGRKTGVAIQGKKRGHNMTLYKREVFAEIGYFDNRRFGGDSEYLDRALKRFGASAEASIEKKLTKAYFFEGAGKNLTDSNPLGSASRVAYREYFEWLHLNLELSENWRFIFDRTSIRKNSNLNNEAIELRGRIVCGLATIELRKNSVVAAIRSLLPQVDLLLVYQNGYKDTSGIFDDRKIRVISSLETGIDLGDAGKFFKVSDFSDCYYFSCDDDLVYPPDYVSRMIEKLNYYQNKVILTCHGNLMDCHPKSYYEDRKIGFHFGKKVDAGDFVHFGGTGVMAFHTGTVNFGFNMFRAANMADIWVGLYAKARNIPIAVCPHEAGWIKHSDDFDVNTTIYYSGSYSKKLQDRLIEGIDFSMVNTLINNEVVEKDVDELIGKRKKKKKEKIIVGVPTFNRVESLKRLLRQLDSAAKGLFVEIIVWDDGSNPEVSLKDSSYDHFSKLTLHRSNKNNGKKGYWKTVNCLLEKMAQADGDFYYYLSDDIIINDAFFRESIVAWKAIRDGQKISLNLLNDGREECWTKVKRASMTFMGIEYYKTQWLDMLIMFDGRLVKHRVEEISTERWEKNPNLSSGVGAQLSQRFHAAGYSMYQLKKSLVFHGDHESRMNPEERLVNPLVTVA